MRFRTPTIKRFVFGMPIILATCLVWNFVLPGVVAYLDNVYSPDDIKLKVLSGPFTAEYNKLQKYSEYEKKRKDYEKLIEEVNFRTRSISIAGGASPAEIESLARTRDIYQKDLAALQPPAKLVSFSENQTLYYILVLFTCFCVLRLYCHADRPGRKCMAESNFADAGILRRLAG